MSIIHGKVKQFLLIFFMLSFSYSVLAQGEVWPGDINNDGIVNNVDAIFLVQGLGQTGPPRDLEDQNIDWYAHPYTNWVVDFFGMGQDIARADGNGDGIIDESDYEPIWANFGLTHDIVTPGVEVLVPDEFDPTLSIVDVLFMGPLAEGDLGFLFLSLEDDQDNSVPFSGLTFSISYDPNLISAGSMDFNFDPGDPLISPFSFALPQNNDLSLGVLEVVIVKGANDEAIMSQDFLGTLSFIIEDDLVSLSDPELESFIQISNITLLDENLNISPVNGDTLNYLIIEPDVTNTTEFEQKAAIKVSPNPARDFITITSIQSKIDQVIVHNSLGQNVRIVDGKREEELSLDRENLPNGIYFMTIYTDKGIFSEKIYFID